MKDVPPSRRRSIASIDLGELKPQAEQRCAAAGLSLSAWIRPLIQQALATASSAHEVPGQGAAAPAPESSAAACRITLDPGLAARIDAMRDAGGFRTRAAVLRAVLAGADTGDSTLSDAVAQLTTSNYQLVGLGRNLNQIARSLNSYPGKTTAGERQALEQAAQTIRAHLELSARVVGDLRPLLRVPKR